MIADILNQFLQSCRVDSLTEPDIRHPARRTFIHLLKRIADRGRTNECDRGVRFGKLLSGVDGVHI